MPLPVRIEAEVWDDWRFECLAAQCGYSQYEAIGRMAKLWAAASDRETDVMPDGAVRTFLGPNGPEAIVASDLGERFEGGIRIKGAHRFEPLWNERRKRRDAARSGGQARAGAPRDEKGRMVAETTNVQPAHHPEASQTSTRPPPAIHPQATLSGSGSGSGSPDSQIPPNPPGGGSGSGGSGRSPKRDRTAPTDLEQSTASEVLAALSKHSGVVYRGSDAHVRLIARQIRAGRTSLDLRKVAWYCALKLDWKNKPEMVRYLRPETLFGPQTIERYLDAAITEYRREFKTDDDITTPKRQISLEVIAGNRESA